MFTWWNAKPYAQADKALAAYIKALREKVVGYRGREDEPIIGNPIGKAALAKTCCQSSSPTRRKNCSPSPSASFAWCDKEMLRASRDMGFGDDWRAALEEGQDAARGAGQADRPRARPRA
jgi:hypothetical protein